MLQHDSSIHLAHDGHTRVVQLNNIQALDEINGRKRVSCVRQPCARERHHPRDARLPQSPVENRARIITNDLRALQEIILFVKMEPAMRRRERLIEQEALVLLVDLPRVLIIERAIVHTQAQAALGSPPAYQ